MFITSFGEQNITYKCCSNFLIHLFKSDPKLDIHWAVVKDWSEKFRYDPSIEKIHAEDLINAVSDEQSGILQWIKKHW